MFYSIFFYFLELRKFGGIGLFQNFSNRTFAELDPKIPFQKDIHLLFVGCSALNFQFPDLFFWLEKRIRSINVLVAFKNLQSSPTILDNKHFGVFPSKLNFLKVRKTKEETDPFPCRSTPLLPCLSEHPFCLTSV